MNKLSTLAAVLLLTSSSFSFASGDHNHAKNDGMMQQSDMMQMHMKTMKSDMMAIQKETDPNKRKSMMKAHMKSMNSMMSTMKNERSMMKDKHMEQMKQLELRVSMMEAMMENLVKNQVILSAPDSTFKWDATADEYQLQ